MGYKRFLKLIPMLVLTLVLGACAQQPQPSESEPTHGRKLSYSLSVAAAALQAEPPRLCLGIERFEAVINSIHSPRLYLQPEQTDEFFENAAFIGNSLVDGLRLFGGISSADFFAASSATVINVETRNTQLTDGNNYISVLSEFLTAAEETDFDKLYLMFGINETALKQDTFLSAYAELIEKLRVAAPSATVYIMSISPVAKFKSDEDGIFTKDIVTELNAALYELARDEKCFYIDLFDALADEEGYLPLQDTTDGIHLKRAKYKQWAQYLREHYVPLAS